MQHFVAVPTAKEAKGRRLGRVRSGRCAFAPRRGQARTATPARQPKSLPHKRLSSFARANAAVRRRIGHTAPSAEGVLDGADSRCGPRICQDASHDSPNPIPRLCFLFSAFLRAAAPPWFPPSRGGMVAGGFGGGGRGAKSGCPAIRAGPIYPSSFAHRERRAISRAVCSAGRTTAMSADATGGGRECAARAPNGLSLCEKAQGQTSHRQRGPAHDHQTASISRRMAGRNAPPRQGRLVSPCCSPATASSSRWMKGRSSSGKSKSALTCARSLSRRLAQIVQRTGQSNQCQRRLFGGRPRRPPPWPASGRAVPRGRRTS